MPLTFSDLAARLRALSPTVGATALFAVALIGGLLLERPQAPPAAPRIAVHHRAPPKRLAARKPAPAAQPQPKPAPPDPYVLEQAMSYRELLDRWTPLVQEASRRFNVSGLWIRAVMQIESGGRTLHAARPAL